MRTYIAKKYWKLKKVFANKKNAIRTSSVDILSSIENLIDVSHEKVTHQIEECERQDYKEIHLYRIFDGFVNIIERIENLVLEYFLLLSCIFTFAQDWRNQVDICHFYI